MNRKIFFSFLVVALVALGFHFMLFELRYVWYLSEENFLFIRIGYGIFLAVLAIAWSSFPSRILVSVIGAAAFVFPPLLRGDVFASMTPGMICCAVISIALLLAATELRRKAFHARKDRGG